MQSILTNEKYMGDALLQKQYTTVFLLKKRKKNEGEVQQYYVEGHHEPIIPSTTFRLVQAEILERSSTGMKYSGVSIFASRIRCGDCGNWYGSKAWHSTDKYRKIVYRCDYKYKGEKKCGTPHLTEEEIKSLFQKALITMLKEKGETVSNLEI